jgi:hypothetical protein
LQIEIGCAGKFGVLAVGDWPPSRRERFFENRFGVNLIELIRAQNVDRRAERAIGVKLLENMCGVHVNHGDGLDGWADGVLANGGAQQSDSQRTLKCEGMKPGWRFRCTEMLGLCEICDFSFLKTLKRRDPEHAERT